MVLAELDGHPVNAAAIPLLDDGATHQVRIVLGEPVPYRRTTGAARTIRNTA